MSSEISLSSEECTSRVLAVCLVFRHVEGEGDLINILVIDSLVLVHQLIILVRGDSLARVGLPSQPEGAHESLTLQDNMLHVIRHSTHGNNQSCLDVNVSSRTQREVSEGL